MCLKELFSHLFKNIDSKGISVNVNSQKGDTKKEKTINKISNGKSVKQINNSGVINNNTGTINNYYANNKTCEENKEEEDKNDEQLYYSYYNLLSLADMEDFIDKMLSGGVWSNALNDKVFDFLNFVTCNPINFFFDTKLEDRRCKLVESCKNFFNGLTVQSGPYHSAETFSLRNEVNNVAKLQESIEIMGPLSKAMYDSYRDLIMYARHERKFL